MNTTNQTQPKRLRAKDIAEQYSVSVPSIWRWAKEGKITPIKVTKRTTVFDSVEIEAFFSGGTAA